MPTTLYPRLNEIGIATYGNGTQGSAWLMTRGTSASTLTATTTTGGTWITIGYFSTPPLEKFTFSGSISCNLRGLESNNLANASLGARFYKWTRAGGLGAQLIQASATLELGTAEGAVTASATAPNTEFLHGDVLVVEIGAINIGTMGSGRTVSFVFNGPTAGASGDSYITVAPTLVRHRRLILTR